MKHVFLLAVLLLAALAAAQSVTCQQIGQFTYCSNGLTANQVGNYVYYSGRVSGMSQRIGDFTYYNLQPVPNAYAQAQQQAVVAEANRQYYATGYAAGAALGRGITALVNRRKMKKFCKEHPALIINGNLYGPYNVCTVDGKPR